MDLGNLPHSFALLKVAQGCTEIIEQLLAGLEVLIQPAAQQPAEELIQPISVPVSVHIGFAESEIAFGNGTLNHARGIEPDIPGPLAADVYIGGCQQVRDGAMEL